MHDWLKEAQATLERYLVENGLRRTRERRAILEIIYQELTHFDAETLYRYLLQKGYKVSRATVYNSLDLFVACGLVKRYSFAGGKMLYERSLGRRQHDHLICEDCGEIQEFCDPSLGPVVEAVGRLFAMQPVRHELVIYARCTRNNCPSKKQTLTFAAK